MKNWRKVRRLLPMVAVLGAGAILHADTALQEQPRDGFVEIDGGRLYYEMTGGGDSAHLHPRRDSAP